MRSGPYVAGRMRFSPPELAREWPGPQASKSVPRPPRRASSSAVQPPKAPAPITPILIFEPGDFMARGQTGSDFRATLRADASTLKVERVGALGHLDSAGGAAHRTEFPHQVQRDLPQQPRGQETYQKPRPRNQRP